MCDIYVIIFVCVINIYLYSNYRMFGVILFTTLRHLLIIVNDKLANGKDRLSVWIHEIIILTIAVFGLVSAYFTYYYCKRRSAKTSLRLAKDSGKIKKTPVYNAVAVYTWSRDDVPL